uniref:Uncharacterized protein n=1 Tax=Anguilla anguilla TaxID=7936 RepID=A0A0E9T6T0_ANGAN
MTHIPCTNVMSLSFMDIHTEVCYIQIYWASFGDSPYKNSI